MKKSIYAIAACFISLVATSNIASGYSEPCSILLSHAEERLRPTYMSGAPRTDQLSDLPTKSIIIKAPSQGRGIFYVYDMVPESAAQLADLLARKVQMPASDHNVTIKEDKNPQTPGEGTCALSIRLHNESPFVALYSFKLKNLLNS